MSSWHVPGQSVVKKKALSDLNGFGNNFTEPVSDLLSYVNMQWESATDTAFFMIRVVPECMRPLWTCAVQFPQKFDVARFDSQASHILFVQQSPRSWKKLTGNRARFSVSIGCYRIETIIKSFWLQSFSICLHKASMCRDRYQSWHSDQTSHMWNASSTCTRCAKSQHRVTGVYQKSPGESFRVIAIRTPTNSAATASRT